MSRLPHATPPEDDPKVRELLDWVEAVEGTIPNHFLLELHFPEHFKAWLQWVRILWDEGELTPREVQHVGIAVSKANACPYCTGSFCAVLERGGASRQEVEEYLERDVALLGGRERALVEFAVKAALDQHGFVDADIARLREVGLGERGIVQLIWLVNMFSSVNRLNTILATDLDATNPFQAAAAELLGHPPH